MNQYRGGGGGASASGGGGAGAVAAGRPLTGDALRKATNLALRQIKKLRKYELEQASDVARVAAPDAILNGRRIFPSLLPPPPALKHVDDICVCMSETT